MKQTESMEECCLLACLSWLSQLHLSTGVTSHRGLLLPTSIINQEDVPQIGLQDNVMTATAVP